MMRIADALVSHGHQVTICAERWDGEVSQSHHVRLFSSKKMTNHGRARSFVRSLKDYIDAEQPDIVIGFNRMPYLDVYFAADVCYADIVEQHHGLSGLLYKMTPRSRTFLDYERAVFGPNSKTRILFLDERQRQEYEKFYKVEEKRCLVLPPGISPNCRYGRYSKEELSQCRHAWGVADHDFLLLQVGSDFKRKGVDRSIRAIADLPEDIRGNSKLVVVGKDDEKPFLALAAELKIKPNVIFTHGIPDASMLIAAADVLIHPARCENTGTVIVEALAVRERDGIKVDVFYDFVPLNRDLIRELVFSEPNHQCIGFKETPNGIEPVFTTLESNYTSTFVFEQILDGALAFVRDFSETFNGLLSGSRIKRTIASAPFEGWLATENRTDMSIFACMKSEDVVCTNRDDINIADFWNAMPNTIAKHVMPSQPPADEHWKRIAKLYKHPWIIIKYKFMAKFAFQKKKRLHYRNLLKFPE